MHITRLGGRDPCLVPRFRMGNLAGRKKEIRWIKSSEVDESAQIAK